MAAAAAARADAEGIHNPIANCDHTMLQRRQKYMNYKLLKALQLRDQTMFAPQREYMDNEFLKALQRGDKSTVERFLPQEVPSTAIDITVADNAADQAAGRRRRWRGVTTVGGNSALHIAADFGHLELAELICARDSSLLKARNMADETPLHCAARAGADRIVSLFISEARRCSEEGVLRATDREGKTALHAAVEEGRAAVARVLMSEDPGLAAFVDSKGVSPLYAAVLSGSLEVVQVLTGSRADGGGDAPEASYAGPNGQTALHAAAIISTAPSSSEAARTRRQEDAACATRTSTGGGAAAAGAVTGVVGGGAVCFSALGDVLCCKATLSQILCNNAPCCLVTSVRVANCSLKLGVRSTLAMHSALPAQASQEVQPASLSAVDLDDDT